MVRVAAGCLVTDLVEHTAAPVGLDAFFAPRSVAVVGVSSSGRGLGATTLKTIKRFGFEYPLVAINPKASEIDGTVCYPSLQAVPHRVDLALLFTSGDQIKQSIADAAAAGVKAVVIFASGFSEGDTDGVARQQDVVEFAQLHGIRVLGPNCQGVVSVSHRLAATFSNALWADDVGRPAPIAYIGQSGAIGGSLFDLGRERGCLPSIWVSTGNQADLGVVELAARVIEDDGIRLLMLYLEHVPNAAEWTALCRRAHTLGKQIVLLRSGTTEAGRHAVASHTGSLVGRDEAFKLVSDANAVITVSDIHQMVDVTMSWLGSSAATGSRLGVVTTSGGAGGLTADLAAAAGLSMATLGPLTVAALRECLSDFAAPQNPVDVTADLVANRPDDLGTVCRIVAGDSGVDRVLVVVSAVVGRIAASIARSVVAASRDCPDRIAVAYLSSRDRTLEVRRIFAEGGVPVFDSITAALHAAAKVNGSRPAVGGQSDRARPVFAAAAAAAAAEVRLEGLRVVTEADGAPALTRAGIAVPVGRLAVSREQAVGFAAELGDDLVLKVQSPDILHKTDLGLVVVGAAAEAVGDLFDDLLNRAGHAAPHAAVDGVLVQRRAPSGVELLVGVQMQDDGYPPLLTVGLGGLAVELYADVVSGLLPVDADAALRMLQQLHGWPLLNGFRGSEPADVSAAVDVLVATADLAEALGDQLVEFEINPLIVHADGRGATAVDFVAFLGNDAPDGRIGS